MVVALAYLSCIHIHRQYFDYGSYSVDITGPLMIITQKVTSLAFSIHDGFKRGSKVGIVPVPWHITYQSSHFRN